MLDTAARVPVDRWGSPSSCSSWTLHQTLRHAADVVQLEAASSTGEEIPLSMDGFDPNLTPEAWLAHSAAESAQDTIDRYARCSEISNAAIAERLAGPDPGTVDGPYGTAHWSTIGVHLFWDAWVHQADMAIPLGIDVPDSLAERRLAAMYGLLMGTLPARESVDRFEGTVSLAHQGGQPLVLGFQGSSADLSVTELPPDATAELSGELVPVTLALSGRGALADVLSGPDELVGALSMVGKVLNAD